MEQETLQVLVSLFVGLVLPWISQWLNERYALSGPKALSLVSALSLVLSVGILFLTGGLTLDQVSFENFVPVLGVVFSVSQVVFQSLKDALGWTK
jgi:hypothetical protein